MTPLPTFCDQEDGMMDSWGRMKVSGHLHPNWRQVCTLVQKEMEIKMLAVKYNKNSEKLQELFIALDNITLLEELNLNSNISDFNVSSVTETMRDKEGVDDATLAKNWGIEIEATKRTRLMTT
jgi:hypothetical protein